MDLNQYVTDATRTESRIDTVCVDISKLMLASHLFIQVGNLLDMIKKNQFYGKPVDVDAWNYIIKNISFITSQASSQLEQDCNDLRTDNVVNIDPRVFHGAIGIATESTELIEAVYLAISELRPLDNVNVCEEALGDVSWYQAILSDAMGVDWETQLRKNIAKLKKRYPDKFTSEAAINRDLDGERIILEADDNLTS